MTGKGIVEALSFVDECYIEEAESGKIHTSSPVRYLLPLAACLCLILTGLRFLPTEPDTDPQENMAVMQEPEILLEIVITTEQKDNSLVMESDMVMEEVESAHVSEVPAVILRIEAWTDEGFTATVMQPLDAEFAPVGTTLTVEMLPNMVVETVNNGLVNAQRRMPTEGEFPAGTLIRVRYQFFTVEDSIVLYIESICKEGE